MSKQVTMTGYMYELDWGYGEPSYRFFASADMADEHYTFIGPVEFAYEVPDSFNRTASKVAALQAKEQALREEFNSNVRRIHEQISKLQAIEYVEA